MKPPYVLVPDNVSTDMVECLETLLEHARKGELIGLAFAGLLKRRGYIVNTAGELHRNPTFARGIVAALDDQLSGRVRGGSS
ncbi:hypothetical protein [Methylibium sp.]|uniref:hypothetical protein n=1 Tax=Methylibium sp. TaxID=2067992 RepID=UPI0018593CF5|nr:hypothetical protein [Methylibium sp.]MBA3589691.1 hypothetical protein [Methylibium sp.]